MIGGNNFQDGKKREMVVTTLLCTHIGVGLHGVIDGNYMM